MSRTVICRWVLTGDLIADSGVHIGSVCDGPTSLTQARDGAYRPVIPGTSLAGVLRAVTGEDPLWGEESERDDSGCASWVRVDDAVAAADTPVEVREHVSIERIHGVAARNNLFSRQMLPAGTSFAFRMVVDDTGDGDGPNSAAQALATRVVATLRGSGVAVGGATTKGLGVVRLHHARLTRQDLTSRSGIITTLTTGGVPVDLPEPVSSLPAGILRATIPFRPRGPLMVQVSAEGDAVDAFPLATSQTSGVRLELPGSSIRGVLRSHAERIMRTLAPTGQSTPPTFLEQMRAHGLGPVAALFGTAGDRTRTDGQAAGVTNRTTGNTGRQGALTAHTCVTRVPIPQALWDDVRLLRHRATDTPDDDQQAALSRLQYAVDRLNAASAGVRFSIAQHVAIDRWTGGSADGLLFATLEPTSASPTAWKPITLDLATSRCADSGQTLSHAVTLLLLVLRDLCDGWIGFGHATTRGGGALDIDPAAVQFSCGPDTEGIPDLHGRTLSDVLDDDVLIRQLSASWPPAPDVQGNEQ